MNIIKTKETNYSKLIEDCLERGEDSNLPDWILQMDGMSGKKYRHFINNLISEMESPKYLEIGCWKGSTTCSAIYKNSVISYCIDNWSEFGGPKKEFCENIERCLEDFDDSEIVLEEGDFRDIKYDEIGKYNVYLFDGPHEEEDQYEGLMLTQCCLENQFIFICDDWNWKKVRKGTMSAIEKLNLNILFSVEIKTTNDDTYPPEENTRQNSDWHNGYYIAVLEKNEIN